MAARWGAWRVGAAAVVCAARVVAVWRVLGGGVFVVVCALCRLKRTQRKEEGKQRSESAAFSGRAACGLVVLWSCGLVDLWSLLRLRPTVCGLSLPLRCPGRLDACGDAGNADREEAEGRKGEKGRCPFYEAVVMRFRSLSRWWVARKTKAGARGAKGRGSGFKGDFFLGRGGG